MLHLAMKKIAFLLLFGITLTTSVFAQTGNTAIPTLSRLQSMLRITGGAAFDQAVRAYGFTFDSKDESDDMTEYTYNRIIRSKGVKYTETFTRRVKTETGKTVSIIFSTARVDLMTHYVMQLTQGGFRETDCLAEAKENQTAFCYNSTSYGLRLVDSKRQEEDSDNEYNSYQVIVYRR
jgi:hypothetical protein